MQFGIASGLDLLPQLGVVLVHRPDAVSCADGPAVVVSDAPLHPARHRSEATLEGEPFLAEPLADLADGHGCGRDTCKKRQDLTEALDRRRLGVRDEFQLLTRPVAPLFVGATSTRFVLAGPMSIPMTSFLANLSKRSGHTFGFRSLCTRAARWSTGVMQMVTYAIRESSPPLEHLGAQVTARHDMHVVTRDYEVRGTMHLGSGWNSMRRSGVDVLAVTRSY